MEQCGRLLSLYFHRETVRDMYIQDCRELQTKGNGPDYVLCKCDLPFNSPVGVQNVGETNIAKFRFPTVAIKFDTTTRGSNLVISETCIA
jgi:hypothetical protein